MTVDSDLYQRIVAAKLYIDENFMNDIDLGGIAREAYLSRFHFHRLFSRVYQKTPHQYLTEKRLSEASLLLAREGISILEISQLIGYESAASFSILFKKNKGFSPQYYRNIAWIKKKLAKEEPKKFIPHCFIERFYIDNIASSDK